MARREEAILGDRVSEAAMRRLTLTRMLIWAAREAREIGCESSAAQIDVALRAIADTIRNRPEARRRA